MESHNSVCICSLNARGLADSQKRSDVFQYLREKKYNIFCLQETHFTKQLENIVTSKWGYKVLFNSTASNAKGLAILINNNFEYELHNEYSDPEGDFMIADIGINQRRILLVNIHSPNKDTPSFYDRLKDEVMKLSHDNVVLVGDWNLILNTKLDLVNYKNINNPKSREKVSGLIADLNLIDIWREEHPDLLRYTWRRGNPFQQARLDFFLLSENLISDVVSSDIENAYRSDHSLISLKFQFNKFIPRRTFWKFNSSLLKDPEYVKKVKESITKVKIQYAATPYNPDNIDSIPLEELELIINDQLFFETLLLEIRAITLSYGAHKKKMEKCKEKELLDLIQRLETSVTDKNIHKLEEANQELQKLRAKNVEGILTRSRAKWVGEGERTSKYFCNMEKRHFTSKVLAKLQLEGGSEITDPTEINNEAKLFYENLYQSRENDISNVNIEALLGDINKLSKEQADSLEGLITQKEALKALKNMKNNKSPGTDGYTAEFYKFFWGDIGTLLVRSINYGFISGNLSVTQREGIITLLPKGNKPKLFLKNWRPISLLNVAYKIASSTIADRLKNVLPIIINEDQTGFLKGRFIGENIRSLYDLILLTKLKKVPGMILLLDFEKAFDSVAWSFIQKSLSVFGFGSDIKQWVELFYKNIKSCVIVNSITSSFFGIGRGCRQGDPLSPYIFLLCAEILAIMIRKHENIKGIEINGIEFLISQYADDTSLFLDGSRKSFENTVQLLCEFEKWSGLKINLDKSEVVWVGSSEHSQVRYMPHLKIRWNPESFTVLGVKFALNLNKIWDLNGASKLLDMRRILGHWTNRSLTPFGKITVIKSLVLSRIVYLLISLPNPPREFIKEMNDMFFKFIWNGKPHKVRKSTLFKSYEEGGLNMFDVEKFIKALKTSWVKRLHIQEAKWKLLLFAEYPILNRINVLGAECVNPPFMKCKNCFWVDVFSAFNEFSNCCIPSTFLDFVCEPIFCNRYLLIDKRPARLQNWIDNGIVHIADLVKDNGNYLNIDEFRIKYPHMMVNYLEFYGVLGAVKKYQKLCEIDMVNETPVPVGELVPNTWSILLNGSKGSRLIYEKLKASNSKPHCIKRWNERFEGLEWNEIFGKITKTTVDTSLRWFQFRVVHRILVTNKTLKQMKIKTNDKCTFCNAFTESIEHLLYECIHVQRFWNKLLDWIKSKCKHCDRLTGFNLQLIIFGISKDFKSDAVFDLLLLMAKKYIYYCKCLDKPLNFLCFQKEVGKRYVIEKYMYNTKCQWQKYVTKWACYRDLIESVPL